MSRIHFRPVAAIVAVVCTAIVAVGMAQHLPALTSADSANPAKTHPLATNFRDVAKDVLPSIVSLETQGKAVKFTQALPFGEDHPFRKFFENDPRFRGMLEQPQERRYAPSGMGSGFIVDPSGVIMTNAHVVKDAQSITVKLHDGREYEAVDWKVDTVSDIAIVRIEGAEDLKPIAIGDSDVMEIGDWVLAFGAPFGLDLSVTSGIISAKGRGLRQSSQEFLQTDAAINPGNSGGPLVNLNGEVIGINTAISTRSGGYDGVGFAIPINTAEWIADQLTESGEVHRAFVGVRIQPVTADLAKHFGTKPGRGAIVQEVVPDSPAERAKLQPGDVILEVNGRQVNGVRNLKAIVERLDFNKSYDMKIVRDGEPMTLQITVEEMPKDYLAQSDTEIAPQAEPEAAFDELGIEVRQLDGEIAEQLGLNVENGVVVASVRDGSPAAEAGVRVGDLVEKIGKVEVNTLDDYRKAMEGVKDQDSVLLQLRDASGRRFVVADLN